MTTEKKNPHEENWFAGQGAAGFVGSVTKVTDIGGDRSIIETHVGKFPEFDPSKDTRIPVDMIDHLREILQERDRMVAATLKATAEMPLAPEPQEQWMLQLKTSCLKIAIDFVRQKYSKGEDHGQAANHDGTPEADAGEGGTAAATAPDKESGSSS